MIRHMILQLFKSLTREIGKARPTLSWQTAKCHCCATKLECL